MEWISVKEKMPPCGELVIISTGLSYGLRELTEHGDFYTEENIWDDFADEITHWMPLPEPPVSDQ